LKLISYNPGIFMLAYKGWYLFMVAAFENLINNFCYY